MCWCYVFNLSVEYMLIIFDMISECSLATNKPTYEKTHWGTFVSSLAVDGDTNGNIHDGSCFDGNYVLNPWWLVDLEDSYSISSVNVYSRTDALGKYYYLSDNPEQHVEYKKKLFSKNCTVETFL